MEKAENIQNLCMNTILTNRDPSLVKKARLKLVKTVKLIEITRANTDRSEWS